MANDREILRGRVTIYRGIKSTGAELLSVIEDKYSMADLVVIDSGPGATEDQKATVDASEVVLVVSDGSWGAKEGNEVIAAMVEGLGKDCLEVVNYGEMFPEVPHLEDSLRAGKVPRDFRQGLEEIFYSLGDPRRVVGVVGGKGGVGKTTVAVSIALAAAGEGMKVVFIDMDDQVGCASLVLTGKSLQKGDRVDLVGGHKPAPKPARKRIT